MPNIAITNLIIMKITIWVHGLVSDENRFDVAYKSISCNLLMLYFKPAGLEH